jgi:cell division septum initiation protein DivIVA
MSDSTQLPNEETQEGEVSKEAYNELVEKLANETQSKASLVAEIKDLREKKQISEAEAEAAREKLEAAKAAPASVEEFTPQRVAEVAEEAAQRVLRNREREEAKGNRAAAMDAFIAEHREFHPDNDEGSLKMAALERKLERFNLSGLQSVSDFKSVFEDASRLVGGIQPDNGSPENPNPLPPNGGGTSPKSAESTVLSSKEMKIIDRTFGGDKERYLKIKAKKPDYVASLLQYSLD